MENEEYELTSGDVVIGDETTAETQDEMKSEEQVFTQETEEIKDEAVANDSEEVATQNTQPSDPEENTRDKPIGVYVKYDENGKVKEVNSDIFITDFASWTKIDEGYGDRFAHAQSQYFNNNEQ